MSLLKICEDFNIRVCYYSPDSWGLMEQFGIPHTSGGYAVVIGDQPYILCDRNRSLENRRYIIAHELGHILLGHLTFRVENGVFPRHMETEANIFAAVMLAYDLGNGSGCTETAPSERKSPGPAAQSEKG